MRFHLVDRIDDYEPGRAARGRKLTSHAETYWRPDEAGRPAMPPPLVLEALCQTASWLILLGSELRTRATLLAIDEFVHHRPVRPGDILDIGVTVESMADSAAVLNGAVHVEGAPVLVATGIMCGLNAGDDLEDAAAVERMARLLSRKAAVR